MIKKTSEDVLKMITGVDTGVSVFLASPNMNCFKENDCIGIYLLEIKQPTSPVTRDLKSLSILLRYLVTSYSQDELKAHGYLENILKAVWLNKDYQLDLVPPAENLWLALGIPKRPCFFIEVICEMSSTEDEIQIVTKDLVLEQHLNV